MPCAPAIKGTATAAAVPPAAGCAPLINTGLKAGASGMLAGRAVSIETARVISSDDHNPKGQYVFSAKGAAFIAAWGSAPGSRTCENASAESAIHSGALSIPMSAMCGIESRTGALSRAFSAVSRCGWSPGALPQAGVKPRL